MRAGAHGAKVHRLLRKQQGERRKDSRVERQELASLLDELRHVAPVVPWCQRLLREVYLGGKDEPGTVNGRVLGVE